VYGKEDVSGVLTAYRDAIQFVHNQTIRYINEGYTPDELVALVKLPDHLAEHPWLGEFYGTVKHAVREIYQGEIGWFNGDPTTLDPITPVDSASRYVELIGGRDKLVREAQKALDREDYQWAAELTTHVIRVNKNDMTARNIKAKSLRALGFKTENTNWRCWYLTSARELEGEGLDFSGRIAAMGVARALPAAIKVEALGLRVAAEKAIDVHVKMGFRFPDVNESYAIEIRRGIAEFHSEMPEGVDVVLTLDDVYLSDILMGLASFEQGIKSGDIKVDGSMDDLIEFFSCFEKPKQAEEIFLTLR